MSIRVVNWNIAATRRATDVARALKKTNADLIALQEVDRFVPRSGNRDIATEIAEELGYQMVFGRALTFGQSRPHATRSEYGLCILSKKTISQHDIFSLSPPIVPRSLSSPLTDATSERRILLRAAVVCDGLSISVYNTHLAYSLRSNHPTRNSQMRKLGKVVNDDNSPHLIFCGDLNETPNWVMRLGLWQRARLTPARLPKGTYPAIPPPSGRRSIDYIAHRGLVVMSADVVAHSALSDHCLLVADLRAHSETDQIAGC